MRRGNPARGQGGPTVCGIAPPVTRAGGVRAGKGKSYNHASKCNANHNCA